ncbi:MULTISPECIES: hypothetical protein [unclassified Thermosynechococcus]|uniref:hypothetical protein n=1 Tax=unclassified Thermosynechococcus TaxID=2622553 RepID=UPI0019E00477|nr:MULTISPECIES: hypothetical protein [unclassified Thermosynechococcus]HIK35664.1 hypothetical protein [Thermosynechococcus sp. M98_K2018_005]HIK47331.1 hypothetical protein [Thermosynechococcus sp. M55_K2018_012]
MTQAYTPEDVWRLWGELLEAQKETERLLREEARQLNQQLGKLGRGIWGMAGAPRRAAELPSRNFAAMSFS